MSRNELDKLRYWNKVLVNMLEKFTSDAFLESFDYDVDLCRHWMRDEVRDNLTNMRQDTQSLATPQATEPASQPATGSDTYIPVSCPACEGRGFNLGMDNVDIACKPCNGSGDAGEIRIYDTPAGKRWLREQQAAAALNAGSKRYVVEIDPPGEMFTFSKIRDMQTGMLLDGVYLDEAAAQTEADRLNQDSTEAGGE